MSHFSQRHRFGEWPNTEIPDVAAGVYVIWHGEQLIYCGMSGREIERAQREGRKRYGLVTRLESHAQGRLSGDQFCVYVANRLVIPKLRPEQLPDFATGALNLDALVKLYIRTHFDYQYSCVATSKEAYELELRGRTGQLFASKPLLNPA